MTYERTPAQLYALSFGVVLLAVGILGFIANASFDAGSDVQGDDFIIFEVNGWHNLVHIGSGLLGLALWRNPATARLYALGFGAVYLVVTIWGVADGDQVLWLLPVDLADNFLHLAIAAIGITAGLVSPAHPSAAPGPAPGPAPGRHGMA